MRGANPQCVLTLPDFTFKSLCGHCPHTHCVFPMCHHLTGGVPSQVKARALELKGHSRHERAVKLSLLLLPRSFVGTAMLQTRTERRLWCCGSNGEQGRCPFLTGYHLVTEAAPTKGDPCQDMGRPAASRSHSRGPSCSLGRVEGAGRLPSGSDASAGSEEGVEHSGEQPQARPRNPRVWKEAGGLERVGALDSEINSGVIHMEESGMWSVWWRGA